MASFATPETPPLARRCGCMLPTCTPQPGALGRSPWHTDCRSLGGDPSGNARQLFYGLPKATCQATLPRAFPEPLAHSCTAALPGLCLWQCEATVLWAPEGDVPGDVRHFGWPTSPSKASQSRPFRAVFGGNRLCRLPGLKPSPEPSRSLWPTAPHYGLPKATCQATSGILAEPSQSLWPTPAPHYGLPKATCQGFGWPHLPFKSLPVEARFRAVFGGNRRFKSAVCHTSRSQPSPQPCLAEPVPVSLGACALRGLTPPRHVPQSCAANPSQDLWPTPAPHYGLPKATCQVTSGILARQLGAAGTQIAGALGVSLWQCQATVLWDPEGDVPGEAVAMPGNWEPLQIAGALGVTLLAMRGNCFTGSRRQCAR